MLAAFGAAVFAGYKSDPDSQLRGFSNSVEKVVRLAPPDVEQLRRLAEEACLCEQEGGQQDCRHDYRAATASYQVESMASACFPISTESDLITSAGEEYFVTTGYNVVGNSPSSVSRRLCRKADAQAVEAAYYEALGPILDASEPIDEAAKKERYEAADRAIVRVLEDIHRGKKTTPISNSKGCA